MILFFFPGTGRRTPSSRTGSRCPWTRRTRGRSWSTTWWPTPSTSSKSSEPTSTATACTARSSRPRPKVRLKHFHSLFIHVPRNFSSVHPLSLSWCDFGFIRDQPDFRGQIKNPRWKNTREYSSYFISPFSFCFSYFPAFPINNEQPMVGLNGPCTLRLPLPSNSTLPLVRLALPPVEKSRLHTHTDMNKNTRP